ncbi:MAG TPA: M14 family metallopeptidase [Pyrinomonadaceae bacterium]|nr:M14 family metallopeptidase [Pyrinomonadaceae bacterium]
MPINKKPLGFALLLVFFFLYVDTSVVFAQRRVVPPPARTAKVPAPEDVLGFKPGADRKLASWNQVLNYFEKLSAASDRVKFEALGKSTMDLPFVMATISAPENLARLGEYKEIQGLLADPRKLGRNPDAKARQLISRGKSVVLITCGIHSTEVGSYLSSMLIAHRLASSNEAEILNILRNTIVLLVPSLNPDGVDIVRNWYDKTLGTPYEGTSPPELYHKYVGHDNNRDWYAFTQVETQITVSKIHNVWRPQIVHDIHQQSAYGARLFLPPYMPPVEPNVPKQIVEGYTELGNWVADQMRAKGFKGVTTGTTYDAWTPARAYSHYHGGVRILSETASARIASPITLKLEELTSREGVDAKKESPNFRPLWEGGEWGLREITNYMTTAALLLSRHAAENRVKWLERFYEIGKEAVRPRKDGELFGFMIKPSPRQPELIKILETGGVEVVEAADAFKLGGRSQPLGTVLVRMDQPYGNFGKALLETQQYPNLRDSEGQPIAPYDVTAHSLSLLMAVEVTPVIAPFSYEPDRNTTKVVGAANCCAPAPDLPTSGVYQSHVPSMDEGWTRWILGSHSLPFKQLNDEQIRKRDFTDRSGPSLRTRYNTIIIPDQPPRTLLNGHRPGTMPPEYTGGLGEEGVKALREFVEEGGTLVFLNRASEFAIEQFKLPVRNVVAGVSRKEFYVPGSILRIELDTSRPVAKGMPKESIAWFENSPVFEIDQAQVDSTRVIAWYPKENDPLLSGWLLGGERLKGKAALVEVTMGKGRVILFGFRPQYRAQSHATYPLLFNALRR